jgi:hypothetical protein
MILSVHQPHYLPWLGYLHKIMHSDCFVFLDRAQYKKREFQNRNLIRTPDGTMWLTVPVTTKGRREQPVREVKIDNSGDWQETHWRSLKACYGKAPHFREYAPFFEEAYTRKAWERLMDLSISVTEYLLDKFEIHTPLHIESDLGTEGKATERIIDICRAMKADVYLSGTGGREYLEEERFAQEGIELRYQEFVHPEYAQANAKDGTFEPRMAAVDLLFNEGPNSPDFLR